MTAQVPVGVRRQDASFCDKEAFGSWVKAFLPIGLFNFSGMNYGGDSEIEWEKDTICQWQLEVNTENIVDSKLQVGLDLDLLNIP